MIRVDLVFANSTPDTNRVLLVKEAPGVTFVIHRIFSVILSDRQPQSSATASKPQVIAHQIDNV